MLSVHFVDGASEQDQTAILKALVSLRGKKEALDQKHLGTPHVNMFAYQEERVALRRDKIRALVSLLEGTFMLETVVDGLIRVSREKKPVADLFYGGNALQSVPQSEQPWLAREIIHLPGVGIRADDWGPKHYIQDSFKTYTRRFAFCVKKPVNGRPEHKWEANNIIKPGDFWEHPGDRHAIDDFIRSGLRNVSGHARSEIVMQAMWLHQERGGTLGVCLTSTPKRLRDNKGVAFARKEGESFWVIDLARVPGWVINLYGRPDLVRGIANQSAERRWTQAEARDHMLASVIKNRELFAADIPASACTEIPIASDWLDTIDWKAQPLIIQAIRAFETKTN